MIKITKNHMSWIFPRASIDIINDTLVAWLNEYLEDHDLAPTLDHAACFLAQVSHESAGLTRFEENLDYSAERLKQVWPGKFPTLGSAVPYHHNPQALANFIYANRMGNGAPGSGDGWKFRGRGATQITGKENYDAISRMTGIPFVEAPDALLEPENAVLSACWFWRLRRVKDAFDSGGFEKATKAINGGLNGIKERKHLFEHAKKVLGGGIPEANTPNMKSLAVIQAVQQEFGLGTDGKIGPLTAKAIDDYRKEHGLRGIYGGVIDKELLDSLLFAW